MELKSLYDFYPQQTKMITELKESLSGQEWAIFESPTGTVVNVF